MSVKLDEKGKLTGLPTWMKMCNSIVMGNILLQPIWNIQFLQATWKASKSGKKEWPVTLEIFNLLTGESCLDIYQKLWAFGITTETQSIGFELYPDRSGIGIRSSFWVPRPQAAMADDILRQHEGPTYEVYSKKIGTGGWFTRPWGVVAQPRSFNTWILKTLFGASDVKLKVQNTSGKEVDHKQIAGKSKIKINGRSTIDQRPMKTRQKPTSTRKKPTTRSKNTRIGKVSKVVSKNVLGSFKDVWR